jgi:hypothetical protein
MSISEAARADLYTGLAEVLGPERAEILMTHLPSFDPSQVATKSDLSSLEVRVEKRFDQVDERLGQLDTRFDQLFIALVAGLFVIVAAKASVIFTVG